MAGRRLAFLAKYRKSFELGFQTAMEYRVNFLISLISAIYPIIIQTFLWTAIFKGSGQTLLYGYTYEQMIAYTFLAGLVTRLVRTGFEYEIMDDVKSGKFSKFLVQPLGYFPYRLSSYFGNKLPGQVMILLILVAVLAGLSVAGTVSLSIASVLCFLLTMLLATALNFLIFYCFSAMAFWIVEVGFLFEGIRIVIILLSGGIFPLEVFGEKFVQASNYLPFKYTVAFSVNVLTGKTPISQTLEGALIQLVWIGVFFLLAQALWKVGGRRYVAVGG
jgi:ABC-2 type transport system permease protein